MKKIFMFLLLGALLLGACSQVEDVEAHEYWARPAAMGGTSAVYMMLHNHTKNDDVLIGASTDVAEAAELHLSAMDANGVMTMTPQSQIDLPAGGEIEFQPGGYHIMLVNLKKDLNVGDKITLVLHFKNHEDITLTVPVQENTDASSSDMNMENMDMATPTP